MVLSIQELIALTPIFIASVVFCLMIGFLLHCHNIFLMLRKKHSIFFLLYSLKIIYIFKIFIFHTVNYFLIWSCLTYLKQRHIFIFIKLFILFIKSTQAILVVLNHYFILCYFILLFLSRNTTCCYSSYAINNKHRQEGWR